jgi:hypothetical protein
MSSIFVPMYVGKSGSVRSDAVKLPEWFLKMKLWMAELASVISLGMLLVWVLMHEYQTLFR